MTKACCNFCLRFIKVEKGYNPKIHRRYCSPQCFMADSMFEDWQSDEEINRRRHYEQLTRGDDDDL